MKNLFWLALVAVAVYFGIMYVPPYFEAYEVKQVLREAANMGWREPDDEKIRDFILNKCKQIGSHYEIREGQEITVPGVVLLNDDVFVTRNEQAKSIVLQVRYSKHINYPFTARQKTLNFSPSVKGDTTPVKW